VVYIALSTLFDLKHLVQTKILLGEPLTTALIFCKFGFQTLLVCLTEWLIWLPATGPLPQT